MLVSGGNAPRQTTQFDYAGNTAATSSSQLASDRWYASPIKLADGRSLITGGATPYAINVWQNPDSSLGSVSMTPEVFDPALGWSSLLGANSRMAFGHDYNRWWYPRTCRRRPIPRIHHRRSLHADPGPGSRRSGGDLCFNEATGSQAVDSSGNMQHGTLMGGANFAAGRVGNAIFRTVTPTL